MTTRRLSMTLRWLVLCAGALVLCATSPLRPAMIRGAPPNEPATDEQGRATVVVTISPAAIESVDRSELRLTFRDSGEPMEGRLWLAGTDVQAPLRGQEIVVTGYHRACDRSPAEDGRPAPCRVELQLELTRPASFSIEATVTDEPKNGLLFGRNGDFAAGANVQVAVR